MIASANEVGLLGSANLLGGTRLAGQTDGLAFCVDASARSGAATEAGAGSQSGEPAGESFRAKWQAVLTSFGSDIEEKQTAGDEQMRTGTAERAIASEATPRRTIAGTETPAADAPRRSTSGASVAGTGGKSLPFTSGQAVAVAAPYSTKGGAAALNAPSMMAARTGSNAAGVERRALLTQSGLPREAVAAGANGVASRPVSGKNISAHSNPMTRSSNKSDPTTVGSQSEAIVSSRSGANIEVQKNANVAQASPSIDVKRSAAIVSEANPAFVGSQSKSWKPGSTGKPVQIALYGVSRAPSKVPVPPTEPSVIGRRAATGEQTESKSSQAPAQAVANALVSTPAEGSQTMAPALVGKAVTNRDAVAFSRDEAESFMEPLRETVIAAPMHAGSPATERRLTGTRAAQTGGSVEATAVPSGQTGASRTDAGAAQKGQRGDLQANTAGEDAPEIGKGTGLESDTHAASLGTGSSTVGTARTANADYAEGRANVHAIQDAQVPGLAAVAALNPGGAGSVDGSNKTDVAVNAAAPLRVERTATESKRNADSVRKSSSLSPSVTAAHGSVSIKGQNGAEPQDGSNPGLARELAGGRENAGAPNGTREGLQGTASGTGAHDTFAEMDGGTSGAPTTWIHAGAHRAEAGFQDPTLGWVGVRADVGADGIHASLVPGTANAAEVLGGQLAGLNAHLAAQHTAVDTVTLASPEGREAGGAMGHAGNQSAGHGSKDGSAPGEQASTGRQSNASAASVTEARPTAENRTLEYAVNTPRGATISVMA